MNIKTIPIICGIALFFSAPAFAQISNLQVNGTSTSFTMASGDALSWSFNVAPTGASAFVEIWYDTNGNGTIEPGTDVLWQSFTQTDGQASNGFGPPDGDGMANGTIVLSNTPTGLPQGKYVLRFSQGGASLTRTGTMTALASQAYTISGTVTVPAGKNASMIFVGAESTTGDHNGPGWWALTNAGGEYQIAMNTDTSGSPWRVHIGTNPFPTAIITPSEVDVSVAGDPSGINFTIVQAAAQVVGTVRDEQGSGIPGSYVSVSNSVQGQFTSVETDANGFYQTGISQSQLYGNTGFAVVGYFENNGRTTDQLDGFAVTRTMASGDSIVRNLVRYSANATISGTVRINGANPGYSIQLAAVNEDSAQSVTWSDSATGAFSFPVTNKVWNYSINQINAFGYQLLSNPTVHPGATGVILNISSTGVAQPSALLPAGWSLAQNYPNPFNPSTTLRYALAAPSHVRLIVYNELGEVVAELVNADQPAGWNEIVWNASVASGMYFYRIEAVSTADPTKHFADVKKMMLIK